MPCFDTMWAALLGLLSVLPVILGLEYRLSVSYRVRYAMIYACMPIIYLFFLLRGASFSWVLTELVGTAAGALLVYLGIRKSSWFSVLAIGTHPLWDLLHHGREDTAWVPSWYPVACLVFDVVLALYIASRLLMNRDERTA